MVDQIRSDVRRRDPASAGPPHAGFRRWRSCLDEMYVNFNGEGEMLESCVTGSRDRGAAQAVMKKRLKRHGSPERIATDGLRSPHES